MFFFLNNESPQAHGICTLKSIILLPFLTGMITDFCFLNNMNSVSEEVKICRYTNAETQNEASKSTMELSFPQSYTEQVECARGF